MIKLKTIGQLKQRFVVLIFTIFTKNRFFDPSKVLFIWKYYVVSFYMFINLYTLYTVVFSFLIVLFV